MEDIFKIFQQFPDLVLKFSQRKDGIMVLGGQGSEANRLKYFQEIGIDPDQVISAKLSHGNNVVIVNHSNAGEIIKETDALITKEKNLFLTVTSADCPPVYLFDQEKKVICLAHVGWRTLVKDILLEIIKKLKSEFGSAPQNILAGIGPGIGVCHFEVKDDILPLFKKYQDQVLEIRAGKKYIDLKKMINLQLIDLGLKAENIEINPDCSHCLFDKYYSFRRDKPDLKNIETMIAVMGLEK